MVSSFHLISACHLPLPCPPSLSAASFVSHKNARKCCILSGELLCAASSVCHSFMRFLRHFVPPANACPTCAFQRHNLTANCSVYSQALNILSTFGCERAEMGSMQNIFRIQCASSLLNTSP